MDHGTWSGWNVEAPAGGALSAVNTYLVEQSGRRFVATATVSEDDLRRFLDGDLDRRLVALLDERRTRAEGLALEARSTKKKIILP